MMKIALLHTTPLTVVPIRDMIQKRLPDIQIYNFVDDSILPMLLEDEGQLEFCFEKMLCYAQFAKRQGVIAAMNVCSSVGGFSDYAKGRLDLPVLRIDDAVTDVITAKWSNITILATIRTTLVPSAELVKRKLGSRGTIESRIVEGAFEANKRGNKALHDRLIADEIRNAALLGREILLAQASMADAAFLIDDELKSHVYTSTGFAVESLARMIEDMGP